VSPFALVDARSAAEAVSLLRDHGPQAQPVAAGGDLLGLLKDGVRGPTLRPPRLLVNLATAEELHRIERQADGGWTLGAMVTLAALSCTSGLPVALTEALGRVASPQLRARTTLGGNLLQRPRCLYFRHPDEPCFKKGGTGCPAVGGPLAAYPGALTPGPCHAGHPSDLAPVLLVLEARAELLGPAGTRQVPLLELFAQAATQAEAEAAIDAGEVLVRLHVPAMPRAMAQAFDKQAPRDANEFATASAAAVGSAHDGRWQALRIALAGVAPGPLLLPTTAVIGQPLHHESDASLAARLLPAPDAAPWNTRLPAARLAVENALRQVRLEAARAG